MMRAVIYGDVTGNVVEVCGAKFDLDVLRESVFDLACGMSKVESELSTGMRSFYASLLGQEWRKVRGLG
jgi:hypothetical protein